MQSVSQEQSPGAGQEGSCTRAGIGDAGCTASEQVWERLLAAGVTSGSLVASSGGRGSGSRVWVVAMD